MTDQYGSNPPHHDEHDVPASEAETWHGDQPPIDDFADHHAGEEAATVSEETEHQGDAAIVDEGAQKKSSMLLPIVACVGGLLFLGALLYWQFGSGAGVSSQVASAPPPPPTASTPLPGPLAAQHPTPALPNAPFDVNSLKPAVPDTAPTTAMANPIPAAPSDVSAQSGSAIPNGLPQQRPDVTASAAPSAPQPTVPVSQMPSPTMPVPTMAAPTPSPANVAPVAQSIDARLTTLATHVEDLQRSLDQATQQLVQVSNMIVANPNPSSNTGMDDRLNRIEQQLAQIQRRPMPPVQPSAISASEIPVGSVTRTTHKARTTHHKKPKPSGSRAVTHSVRHDAVADSVQPKAGLVVRAAVPGEAWVAKDATTRELVPVHVGDDVPGIGHVQNIHQVGDTWVVEGTNGTLQ